MKKFFICCLTLLLICPLMVLPDSYAEQLVSAPAVEATRSKHNVYIPYDKLGEVINEKDKGVFIPYSDFLQLWEEATKQPPKDKVPPPPIDAAIIHAEYKGMVYDDIAEFQAKLKVSAIKDKWASLILNIDHIAITSLSIAGKTPLLKPVPNGVELILPEKGEYELDLKFSTRVSTAPGEKFINFQIPSSPLTKIDMTVPGKDLDVKIEPMLSQKSNVVGENTEFSAFLSPEGKVNIRWLAKSQESKTDKSLLFANLQSEVFIKESVYLINTFVDVSIMQAKTDEFKVKIPKELSLVRVEGQNIKDWDMAADGTLTVNLYEEVENEYNFTISTEKFRDVGETSFEVPQLEVVGAKREDGIIIIKAEPSLRVQVDKKDRVTQVDPKELRGRIVAQEFVSAFKYFRRPYLVSLNISKIEPKITAKQNIFIAFSETIIDYHAKVMFKVKDAGIFKFRFEIPENFRIAEIGDESTVDSYVVNQEGDKRVLTVTLKNKAYGDFILPIHLEADKLDNDVDLGLPKLLSLDAEKEEGIIALSLRKNLKLSTQNMKSLRPMSLEELRTQGVVETEMKNEIAAGYRYSTTDYSCQLNIDKRRTKIMANVERAVDIQETVLKINDTVKYNILYAPVRQFKVELPMAYAKDAVITGRNIKEKRLSADKDNINGIWTIDLHSPVLNKYTLNVNIDQKLDATKTGEKRNIVVPSIRVLDVFNESGYLSIVKSPNLQVEADDSNLEPIDTKELPSTINRAQAVLAFRYLSHPYTLSLETTKHEYEKVLDTVVNQAHFDIVVSKEGVAKTEGIFKIQNTNRQSLELTMPKGTDKIYSVFISGKKASISRGSSDLNKIIMLPKNIAPGKEFTLRIIYQTKIKSNFGLFGGFKAQSAEIGDIPSSKITWRVYLPTDYSYLYLGGSLTPSAQRNGLFDFLESAVSYHNVRGRNRITLNNLKIPQQVDEQALYGLDIDLVREGRLYSFSKLDKNAYLKIWYVKKNAQLPMSLFLMALGGFLFFRIWNLKGKERLMQLTICIGSLLFLIIFLPQGFKYFVLFVFLGMFLTLGYFALGIAKEKDVLKKMKWSKKPKDDTQS